MAASDSRAEQTVLSENRVNRKVIETQCEMRTILLPEVPSEMRVGLPSFQKCPVHNCVCSAVTLNPGSGCSLTCPRNSKCM